MKNPVEAARTAFLEKVKFIPMNRLMSMVYMHQSTLFVEVNDW